ncbi:siderophore-interacting protein [Rathayibacter oskolensis]|uniref:siderophore-interacting protein n=1 Tax=Rathayibacter oskolensis TaxID=1891671 RepID=UPI003466FABF
MPAISAILESLDDDATGAAFLEVPSAEDRLALRHPAGVSVTWIDRSAGAAPGAALGTSVRAWATRFLTAHHRGVEVSDVDVDSQMLWEVPEESTDPGLYAWIAGEAGAIKLIRRCLVTELDLDRKRVAFMGYWRTGRPNPTRVAASARPSAALSSVAIPPVSLPPPPCSRPRGGPRRPGRGRESCGLRPHADRVARGAGVSRSISVRTRGVRSRPAGRRGSGRGSSVRAPEGRVRGRPGRPPGGSRGPTGRGRADGRGPERRGRRPASGRRSRCRSRRRHRARRSG